MMPTPAAGVNFSLRNTSSNLFLGIRSGAQYAGAEAALVASSDEYLPRWFLGAEQGANYLINSVAPTLCLNVAYESTAIGASLQQWNCNGGASELWTLIPGPGDSVLLINKNSGLAAGVAEITNGSPILQVVASTGNPLALWELAGHPDTGEICELPKIAGTRTAVGVIHVDSQTLPDEMIYQIYVPIYSSRGDLQSVIQDLPRIVTIGFSTILLMPIHPIGTPTGSHPAVGSPYAVADFYAVDPALGQLSDFATLVSQAHKLGLKIIMDVVLNHTAWTHPLISQRPEFYVHNDHRKEDPNSIAQAFWFEDVAQLDYKSGTAVRDYMCTMLSWWMQDFHIDGFRFDTVDNPSGNNRMIPASVWSFIGNSLNAINPKAILLGECTNPNLSLKPFNMDYTNYSLQPAIVSAIRSQDATRLNTVLNELKEVHPKGMLHTSIMQTWDMDLDLNMYGGSDGTLVAAVFNLTIEGVPVIFAGEEVGNDRSGVNTHSPINWGSPLASRFTTFYKSMGTLRRQNAALRRGVTKWLKVPDGGPGLVAYIRTYENDETLVAINFSASSARGMFRSVPSICNWSEVTPPGAAFRVKHPSPPHVELGPWDFAVFTGHHQTSERPDINVPFSQISDSQHCDVRGLQSRMSKILRR